MVRRMIHVESWHVEAEALEKERLRLIRLLQDREIDLESFYHRMRRMETDQGLLDTDDRGYLVMSPRWLSVHSDWMMEKVLQGQQFARYVGGLPSGQDSPRHPDSTTSIQWEYFVGLYQSPHYSFQLGERVVAPTDGGLVRYTKDEVAFNDWFQDMLKFGREWLQQLGQPAGGRA